MFNQFRVIWADHGDDVSRQYAGTGALKSGFTRTGALTPLTALCPRQTQTASIRETSFDASRIAPHHTRSTGLEFHR